jgi:hypothetical protein
MPVDTGLPLKQSNLDLKRRIIWRIGYWMLLLHFRKQLNKFLIPEVGQTLRDFYFNLAKLINIFKVPKYVNII